MNLQYKKFASQEIRRRGKGDGEGKEIDDCGSVVRLKWIRKKYLTEDEKKVRKIMKSKSTLKKREKDKYKRTHKMCDVIRF